MRRTDTSDWPCNIARSASVLGDHWNILLIRQACLGIRRYEQFQRTLGIGRNMLTIRLNGLVEHGILERVDYQANPPRHEYRLTDKGRALFPAITALRQWADRWVLGTDKAPMHAVEIASGEEIAEVRVLSRAGRELAPWDVALIAGPGATRATRARLEAILKARKLA